MRLSTSQNHQITTFFTALVTGFSLKISEDIYNNFAWGNNQLNNMLMNSFIKNINTTPTIAPYMPSSKNSPKKTDLEEKMDSFYETLDHLNKRKKNPF